MSKKNKICIIISDYYPIISKNLLSGSVKELKKNKLNNYLVIKVPGVFEIPTVFSSLVNKYEAFILLGCVIKGKTSHYDHLCDSVFNSIIKISTKHKVPVGVGILTCNNKQQAIIRSDIKKGNKGGMAAIAAIRLKKIII